MAETVAVMTTTEVRIGPRKRRENDNGGCRVVNDDDDEEDTDSMDLLWDVDDDMMKLQFLKTLDSVES